MTNTEKEVFECEESIRLADASYAPDTSAILEDLLADNVTLIGPQGQLFTKSFVLENHRPPKKRPFDKVTVTELIIRDLGMAAVVSCRAEYQTGGQAFSLRCTRTWQKQDGKWRVVLGTITSIA